MGMIISSTEHYWLMFLAHVLCSAVTIGLVTKLVLEPQSQPNGYSTTHKCSFDPLPLIL